MDPFTLALAGVGMATSLFGAISGAGVAQQTASVSANIASQEEAENDQREKQMELQAGRQQTQNIRNTQQARALGLTAATSSGSQFGSGLAGAQGAATDMGTWNALGINQNLGIGRTLYGLSNNISADKIKLAQLGGQAATDQGISNFGAALTNSSGTLGKMAQGVGGLFGGGGATGSWSNNPTSSAVGDATNLNGFY